MKKFFVLLLTVLLVLSCAGCSKNRSGEFDYIVEMLEAGDYEEAKAAIDELQGVVYHEPDVVATQAVEEEIVTEPQPEEDIAESEETPVVSGSTVKALTNMVITRVDNLGNESTDNYYFYNYDEYGRIAKIGGHELAAPYGIYLHTFADYLKIAYTPDGKIENVKVVDSWDNVSELGTPTYDENGNMVSMHVQSNTDEFTLNFSYDANGNCIRADIYDCFWEEVSFDICYTYDSEGRLIKEVWDCVGFGNTGRTIDYTYDENGRLVQSVKTWHENQRWQEVSVYSYDEDGDIIQAVTTTDHKESGYKTKTTDYMYTNITVIP